MRKLITALVLVSLANVGLAGGWGRSTTITGFYVWSNGNAHFRVANMENPDGCSGPQYLTLDATAPNFKMLYATLMTAYASGSTVQLSYAGCTAGGAYPIINAIATPAIW